MLQRLSHHVVVFGLSVLPLPWRCKRGVSKNDGAIPVRNYRSPNFYR